MRRFGVLECVLNVSEGRDPSVVAAVSAAAGPHLLDVHRDPVHNRSVVTVAGHDVEEAARAVVREAVARIDVRAHDGVHPRFGAADVVPFVPLAGAPLEDALAVRDRFARWAADELGVPCFLYGPERSLPEVRRQAFATLAPDTGPRRPHATAGASAVGARPVLVAFNVWLAPGTPTERARAVARAIRGPALRVLAFDLGSQAQVSCNLVDPLAVGPADAFDAVAALAPVERAELVGLVPDTVLHAVPRGRWGELDLDPSKTIEARLERAGLDRRAAAGPSSAGRGRR